MEKKAVGGGGEGRDNAKEHFDDWIKRSEGFLPYVDRQIALLKESVNKKYVVNCVVAKKTLNGIKDGAEPSVEKNPFYRPLKKLQRNMV